MVNRFGRLLRNLRNERGIGSRELSLLAGLSHSSVNHYEMDRQIPTQDALCALAGILEVPIALLGWFAYIPVDEDENIFKTVESGMQEYLKGVFADD